MYEISHFKLFYIEMVVYNIFQILPYSRLLMTKAKVKELYDNEDSAKNSAIFSLSFPMADGRLIK